MTSILKKAFGRYGFIPLMKAIQVHNDELANCQTLQDLGKILESLRQNQTFPDDRVEVPRDALTRILSFVVDDIYRNKPFRKSALPQRVSKKLSSRKLEELEPDHQRARVFLSHLVKCPSQEIAIQDAADELNIDRATMYRSLKRIIADARKIDEISE